MSADEINFKGDNPGAVRYGNFINYYSFHPVDERIRLLPTHSTDVWDVGSGDVVCLDIGCNAGDLTVALYEFFRGVLFGDLRFLGVDIDPTLIVRANECNKYPESIQYSCLDFMDNNQRGFVREFLEGCGRSRFSVTCCFSVTMWIHLNHGDEGLEHFVSLVCGLSELVVVEPQPWKCYKTAMKRLRQTGAEFPSFGQLKLRGNVGDAIEGMFARCGFIKSFETPPTAWDRKIQFYKKKS